MDDQNLLDQTLNFARGHQEFKDLYFKQYEAEFLRLVKEGQNPQILFISCSDSRVVPDLILNARPGDLFVIRNAGNFIPPIDFPAAAGGVAATIQYAVEVLNVRHIIICGHSHCGAIRGLFQDLDPKLDILKRWLKLGEDAKEMALVATKFTKKDSEDTNEDIYSVTEKISVIYQLEHLLTYPFVKERLAEGKIAVHGWYFKLETGKLWYYNGEQYRFLPLEGVVKP